MSMDATRTVVSVACPAAAASLLGRGRIIPPRCSCIKRGHSPATCRVCRCRSVLVFDDAAVRCTVCRWSSRAACASFLQLSFRRLALPAVLGPRVHPPPHHPLPLPYSVRQAAASKHTAGNTSVCTLDSRSSFAHSGPTVPLPPEPPALPLCPSQWHAERSRAEPSRAAERNAPAAARSTHIAAARTNSNETRAREQTT